MEKIKCSTPDFAKENAKKLLALFPECEGQKGEVDIDKLRQVLSSTAIEGNVERYQFTWPGKRNAMAAASAATTKTLRPCAAESVGRDGTPGGFDSENLYIEGDNLEVLKLLQTSYAGKVKMIYIDPPYNTGHDFVYRDRFSLTQKELDDNAGAFDEDGNRFEVNDSAEARYHSNWCSMMYPRLKLARNLLRDDGVIFISIDDNEVTNLRRLCDEVFGCSQFLTCITRSTGTPTGGGFEGLVNELDYILVYAKDKEYAKINGLPMDEEDARIYDKEDEYGRYLIRSLRRTGGEDRREDRPTMYYPITAPDGTPVYPTGPTGYESRWICAPAKIKELIDNHLLEWGKITRNGKQEWHPFQKYYLENRTKAPGNLWTDVEGNKKATREVRELFDSEKVFDFPKPTDILCKCLRIASDADSLVLDFFSGSATTAHSVMRLNAEDGGNRKFIMVQLPESCDEDSEAAKAGYANICEIGKERIRRAGKKIAEALAAKNAEIAKKNEQGELGLENPDNPVNPVEKEIPDIGFRVLKLDTSSLRDTSAMVSATNQEFANFERVRSDRSAEDLLFQMLLETHIPLSESIVKAKVAGNEMLFVGVEAARSASAPYQNAPLAACLDAKAKMTTEFFLEIAKLKPGLAFFRDDAFVDDSARTNLQQVFNQFSPTTSIKVI